MNNAQTFDESKQIDSSVTLSLPVYDKFVDQEEKILYENNELLTTMRIQIVQRKNSKNHFGNLYLEKSKKNNEDGGFKKSKKDNKDGGFESFTISNPSGKSDEFFKLLKGIVAIYKDIEIKQQHNSNSKIMIAVDLKNCEIHSIVNKEIISDSDYVSKFMKLIKCDDEDFLEKFFSSDLNINTTDMLILAKRKHGLKKFEALLNNQETKEIQWQEFFENHQWIVATSLATCCYITIDGKKLEQTTSGNDCDTHGKRADMFLSKNSNSTYLDLMFVEIKSHNTQLLNKNDPYRNNFRESDGLSGAVAQIRNTVAEFRNNAKGDHQIDYHTKRSLQGIKLLIIIGHTKQLDEVEQSNKLHASDNYKKAFDVYRNNLKDIEIITYDELFEKAKAIVEFHKK